MDMPEHSCNYTHLTALDTHILRTEYLVQIGRATKDIEVGQEALLDYGKEYWDKQGTVVAGMLDVHTFPPVFIMLA